MGFLLIVVFLLGSTFGTGIALWLYPVLQTATIKCAACEANITKNTGAICSNCKF